jgi:hypothetical protein
MIVKSFLLAGPDSLSLKIKKCLNALANNITNSKMNIIYITPHFEYSEYKALAFTMSSVQSPFIGAVVSTINNKNNAIAWSTIEYKHEIIPLSISKEQIKSCPTSVGRWHSKLESSYLGNEFDVSKFKNVSSGIFDSDIIPEELKKRYFLKRFGYHRSKNEISDIFMLSGLNSFKAVESFASEYPHASLVLLLHT